MKRVKNEKGVSDNRTRQGRMRGAFGGSRKLSAAILGVMLVVVLLFAVGCGGGADTGGGDASSDGSGAEGGDKVVIKLQGIGGDPTRLGSATIALAKGYFEEEGIEIEDVGVIDIPQHVSALTSGTVDAVALMTSEGLTAFDNGAEIVQVSTDITTAEDLQHMTFIVNEDSPIQNGEDLIGTKIGTASASGGCTAGFPLEYMRQAGVKDPKSQSELLTIPEESLVTALEAGDADVAGVHLTREQVETLYPDKRILFTDWDILGDTGGDTGWFFRTDYAKENPETVTKFIRAITKANKWINENREEAGELYAENAISLNPDLFWIANFSNDGLIDDSHVQVWIDLFASGDSSYTLQNKDTKVADFTTNEYNPSKQ
ncbi:MAG: ABC transporter substrate-binding protein [Clostridiales Family XIII bacterium]|jgi:ABC-type nitrate/sulfonate/bicarbonate transport system substrate-binding protein|nr:ABC transporter substrate-binding protein [Clostridiales Family XIII bacterium]